MVKQTQDNDTKALEAAIGYNFKNLDLLHLALTHDSATANRANVNSIDNERLEFLGDRVLGLIIAGMLYEIFPDEPEGVLAKRYNVLVSGRTCAEIARIIDLGRYLHIGRSEKKSGGRNKTSLLGDGLEALLGAVYLDGGLEPAGEMIAKFWQAHLDKESPPPVSDAKSTLQEWAQARGFAQPLYVMKTREGPDHAPVFTISVEVKKLGEIEADGDSKRVAEQAAARKLLIKGGIWKEDDD